MKTYLICSTHKRKAVKTRKIEAQSLQEALEAYFGSSDIRFGTDDYKGEYETARAWFLDVIVDGKDVFGNDDLDPTLMVVDISDLKD